MSEEKNDLNLPDPEKHWCPKCKKHGPYNTNNTDFCNVCNSEVFPPNDSLEERKNVVVLMVALSPFELLFLFFSLKFLWCFSLIILSILTLSYFQIKRINKLNNFYKQWSEWALSKGYDSSKDRIGAFDILGGKKAKPLHKIANIIVGVILLIGCIFVYNTYRNYSLINAVQERNIEAVKKAIDDGASVNAYDWLESGSTLLHYAETKEIVELLITNGANVNAKNKNGETPLDYNRSMEEHLRVHGAKHSSIHSAARYGDVQGVEEFLDAGVDVNEADHANYEMTALHLSAKHGHREVVEFLITREANVNVMDIQDTPLDLASSKPEIADLLRKHGAKTAEELKAEKK
jgi:hypothetical protein